MDQINNEQFLELLFPEVNENILISNSLKGPYLAAGDCMLTGVIDQYFTVSLLDLADSEKALIDISNGECEEELVPCYYRKIAQFKGLLVLVVDDVVESIYTEKLINQELSPTYVLQTSPKKEQWGWVLSPMETNPSRAEGLVQSMLDYLDPNKEELVDRAGALLHRLVRLPDGYNCKAIYQSEGAPPFKCKLKHFAPDLRYSSDALEEVLGINSTRMRNWGQAPSLPAALETAEAHPIWRYFSRAGGPPTPDGWWGVHCPNEAHHTEQDPNGAYLHFGTNGKVTFKCFHKCGSEPLNLNTRKAFAMVESSQGLRAGALHKLVCQHAEVLKEKGRQVLIEKEEKLIAQNEEKTRVKINRERREGKKPLPAPLNSKTNTEKLRYQDWMEVHNSDGYICYYHLKKGYKKSAPQFNSFFSHEYTGGNKQISAVEAYTSRRPQGQICEGFIVHPGSVFPPKCDERVITLEGKRLINMWQGIEIQPQKKVNFEEVQRKAQPWLNHANYLFKDEEQKDVLDWLACLLQQYADKPSWGILHRGTTRCGKDLFYKPIISILGGRQANTAELKDLDKWGDYTFSKKLILLNESDTMRHSDKGSKLLKRHISSQASGIKEFNLKGKGIHMGLDLYGVLMMQNSRDGFALDETDMRFYVVDSFVKRKPDYYYDKFYRYLEKPETLQAIADYLYHRKLQKNFSIFNLPLITEGFKETVMLTQYEYIELLTEIYRCDDGPFRLALPRIMDIHSWYKMKHSKNITRKQIRHFLELRGLDPINISIRSTEEGATKHYTNTVVPKLESQDHRDHALYRKFMVKLIKSGKSEEIKKEKIREFTEKYSSIFTTFLKDKNFKNEYNS